MVPINVTNILNEPGIHESNPYLISDKFNNKPPSSLCMNFKSSRHHHYDYRLKLMMK